MRAFAGQVSHYNPEILWGWITSAGRKWGHQSPATDQKMNLSCLYFPVIWIHRRLIIFFTAAGPETDSYHTFIFFPIIFYTAFKYGDICTPRSTWSTMYLGFIILVFKKLFQVYIFLNNKLNKNEIWYFFYNFYMLVL